ncbi:MAG: hypothetical protein AB4426_14805 [Xenococcaceae cyanobacterium]
MLNFLIALLPLALDAKGAVDLVGVQPRQDIKQIRTCCLWHQPI